MRSKVWRKKRLKYNVFAGGKHHADKYNQNPIHRWLVNGFMDSLLCLVEKTGKQKIFEIGCGEGQLLGVLYGQGYDVSGMDVDPEAVNISLDNFERIGAEGKVSLTSGNLYELSVDEERIKECMLICCEVLEHVSDPNQACRIISECTEDYFIVSVPYEPIWCILNMMRGKYLRYLGNTPGHINHWSKQKFVKFVSNYGNVIEVRTPLPWIMILAKKKKGIDTV